MLCGRRQRFWDSPFFRLCTSDPYCMVQLKCKHIFILYHFQIGLKSKWGGCIMFFCCPQSRFWQVELACASLRRARPAEFLMIPSVLAGMLVLEVNRWICQSVTNMFIILLFAQLDIFLHKASSVCGHHSFACYFLLHVNFGIIRLKTRSS